MSANVAIMMERGCFIGGMGQKSIENFLIFYNLLALVLELYVFVHV